MLRPIMKSRLILSQVAQPATPDDISIAQDLRDTLAAHAHECVGMAANMIGVVKSVIIFDDNGTARVMFNPEIVKHSGEYATEEGCLSLQGTRPTKRWRKITVQYEDELFVQHTEKFSGWTAQIIQHEIDHTHGIII